MTLFARHDTSYKSQKWSSNVRDGDCRDGDKMLYNKSDILKRVGVGSSQYGWGIQRSVGKVDHSTL